MPELACKKRKTDETMFFVIAVIFTILVGVFIPVVYYANIDLPIVKTLVLGIMGFTFFLLFITACVLFKVAFI